MKVTKREELDFEDLDAEDQRAYLKTALTEFVGRAVAAVGFILAGLWYIDRQAVNWTTGDIVLFSIGLMASGCYVGYAAYKRRERILHAIEIIQNGGDGE